MSTKPFDTPLVVSGPLRAPKQMLAAQEYDGHVSIHDDKQAADLGLQGAPIEGPTHFSQFDPLLTHIWGKRWFEAGCISSHYQNMVVEGEEVRAFVELSEPDPRVVQIRAEKKDGTPVLKGTASIGPEHPETELDRRMAKLRPAEKLVIVRDLGVGQKGANEERVSMGADQHMGDMYPFSLADKLKVITEPSDWYTSDGASDSPWGRPIIPFEMVSVLTQYTGGRAGWDVKGPSVGLFADLEVRMVAGPLLVGKEYALEREVVALSESRRTESYWVRTLVKDGEKEVARVLLNHAIMKNSYAKYEEELASL